MFVGTKSTPGRNCAHYKSGGDPTLKALSLSILLFLLSFHCVSQCSLTLNHKRRTVWQLGSGSVKGKMSMQSRTDFKNSPVMNCWIASSIKMSRKKSNVRIQTHRRWCEWTRLTLGWEQGKENKCTLPKSSAEATRDPSCDLHTALMSVPSAPSGQIPKRDREN